MPEATNGGKTYKFKLRQGIKYSDGTPVKASDFENTIKRLIVLGGPFLLRSRRASRVRRSTREGQEAKADIPGIVNDDEDGGDHDQL